MPLRWLHLANLGFGETHPRAARARQALPALLRERRDAGEPVDLILVAGDIAAAGTPDAYRDAAAFFGRLADSGHIQRGHILVVPGDADIDPRECVGRFSLNSEDESSRYFSRKGALRHLYKLHPFVKWHDGSFTPPFPTDSTCDVQRLTLDGRDLAILRINTALFAQPPDRSDRSDRTSRSDGGELWVGRVCLQRALDTLPPRDAAVRIALLHHPFSWLHPAEQAQVGKRLRGSMDVILRARLLSEASALAVTSAEGTVVELAAGEGLHHRHAFIAMLEAATLTVEPLRYEDEPERWTLDTSAGGLGRYTLEAHRPAPPPTAPPPPPHPAPAPADANPVAAGLPAGPALPAGGHGQPSLAGPALPAGGHGQPSPAAAFLSAEEQANYLALLREQHHRLPMVGLGADRLRLSLDDIYVPLRLQPSGRWAARYRLAASKLPNSEDVKAEDAKAEDDGAWLTRMHHHQAEEKVDLEKAFELAGDRQLFIIGQPGSGKTTALRKLLWLCLPQVDQVQQVDQVDQVQQLDQAPRQGGALGGQAPAAAANVAADAALPLLPIFVHIRQLDGPALGEAFHVFLQRELERQASLSERELAPDLAERLWRRGRLLLLLDGLDEVADPTLRASICRRIERESEEAARRGIRMAVSCRVSGIDDGGEVDLSCRHFLKLDVQPLDADHTRALVIRWFMAAEQSLAAVDNLDLQAAKEQGARRGALLADKLDSPENRTKLRTIVGNPLLLTQLCLVAFNGGEIPDRRAKFFAECLELLLGRWIKGRGEPPLLSTDQALKLLRPLAWTLHCKQRKYDLTEEEAREAIRIPHRRLEDNLAKALPLKKLLRWFQNTTGVLHEYAAGEYGFSHLHFQEYLAAEHASRLGEEGARVLAEGFGADWWEEVVQLYVAVDDRGGFEHLMQQVLAGDVWLKQNKLLRTCLRLANEADLAPFLTVALDAEQSPDRRAAALAVVSDRRGTQVTRAAASIMVQLDRAAAPAAAVPTAAVPTPDAEASEVNSAAISSLRAHAEQIETRPLLNRDEEEAERLFDVFLSHNSRDKPLVRDIYRQLLGHKLRPWFDEEDLPPGQPWQKLLERAIETTKAAAVFLGPSGMGPWEEPEMRACLGEFVRREMPVIPVLLPGAEGHDTLPLFLRGMTAVDMREGIDREGLARLVWGITGEKPEPVRVRGVVRGIDPKPAAVVDEGSRSFTDDTTGIRFLWIPPGAFMMGADDISEEERPIHRVEVSGFWLGETPVTNRQYGVYLQATGAEEPDHWRNRILNGSEQPVVRTLWYEAKSFCRWLAGISGRAVVLPSEAQWEYAARGSESWSYPWGNEEPRPEHAAFNHSQNTKNATMPVGSYPAGRGPFGTLDQAGNIWEWCEDAWDGEAYKRFGRANRDPITQRHVSTYDHNAGHAIRGGSWVESAPMLRAACRLMHMLSRGYRDDFLGFRVAVLPRAR